MKIKNLNILDFELKFSLVKHINPDDISRTC